MVLRKRKVISSKSNNGLSLPTELSVPSNNLLDYSIFIYGAKKIGKTTLAAEFAKNKKTFFMMTENGAKALKILQEKVNSWSDFVGYIDLVKNDNDFGLVVVDTVDVAYDLCMKHVCSELKIKHPNDLGYGKAWTELKIEFIEQINKLVNMDKGVIFTSHDKLKTSKTYEIKHKVFIKFCVSLLYEDSHKGRMRDREWLYF